VVYFVSCSTNFSSVFSWRNLKDFAREMSHIAFIVCGAPDWLTDWAICVFRKAQCYDSVLRSTLDVHFGNCRIAILCRLLLPLSLFQFGIKFWICECFSTLRRTRTAYRRIAKPVLAQDSTETSGLVTLARVGSNPRSQCLSGPKLYKHWDRATHVTCLSGNRTIIFCIQVIGRSRFLNSRHT
jgi:hypothetical protein